MGTVKVNDLLKIAVKRGASDLHLKVGSVPMLRLRGELRPVPGGNRLTHDDLMAAVSAVLPTDVRDTFADTREVDLAYSVAGLGRFRCNTFHQHGTIGMIFRIIAVFPPHQQQQVRNQLASVIKAVISQRLVPKADGTGRAPAVEVMVSTAFIRDCIVDASKTHLIRDAIAQGTSQYGMQTFDQSLFRLYEKKIVSSEDALRWATNVDAFVMKMQGVTPTSGAAVDEMARASSTSASHGPRSGR